MQRGRKLFQAAAKLGCAPALSTPCASHAVDAVPAPCLLCLRNVVSLPQAAVTSKRQQDLVQQKQHQRPLLRSSALHQQYRQLFGIGDASDTHKDYKERRLIG